MPEFTLITRKLSEFNKISANTPTTKAELIKKISQKWDRSDEKYEPDFITRNDAETGELTRLGVVRYGTREIACYERPEGMNDEDFAKAIHQQIPLLKDELWKTRNEVCRVNALNAKKAVRARKEKKALLHGLAVQSGGA